MNDSTQKKSELAIEELARQAFGSPGGKSRIVKKLVRLVPKHEVYVEPFAGGAAMFWNKESVKTEVLNDFDDDIANAYKFIRDITPEQIEKLKKLDWEDTKKKFFYMRDDYEPKNELEQFYKFIYTFKTSYGGARKTYGYKKVSNQQIMSYLTNLTRLQERLKGVKVYNEDYKDVIKKYDSPDTFIYLDPPYPEEWEFVTEKFTKKDYRMMHDLLKSCKGKVLLSTNILPWIKQMFSDFHITKIFVPRTFQRRDKAEYEYLISNYGLKELAEEVSTELTVVKRGDKWCVVHGHPIKPGSKTDKPPGSIIKCFPTKEEAVAMHKAIIVSQKRRGELGETGSGDVGGGEITGGGLQPIWVWKPKKKKKDFEIIKIKVEDLEEKKSILDYFQEGNVVKDFISILNSKELGKLQILIRLSKPTDHIKKAIETRILKMIPESFESNKVQFIWGDPEGEYDSFIPLYDLQLKKLEPRTVKMSEMELIEKFVPYLPQKPHGSACYEVEKVLEALKF
jgi:DNA adenine methylase